MNTYKRILIIILVFVIAFSYPLSVSATDATAVNVSDEDKKKFDLFFGEGNWTVNAEGYAECSDWDKSPAVSPTSKLDDFFATGLGVTGIFEKYGNVGLIKGLKLKEWLDRNIDTDINVQKVIYDNNKEDYKVTVSKKAMAELQKSFFDYCTPLQGYYLLESTHDRNSLFKSYSLRASSLSYDKVLNFFLSCNNVLRLDSSTNSNYDSSSTLPACINMDSSVFMYIYESRSSNITYFGFINENAADVVPNYITFNRSFTTDTVNTGRMLVLQSDLETKPLYYSGTPLKIFYSKYDAIIYLNQLKGTSVQNIYLSNSFYNYQPSNYSFDMSTYNDTDWTTVNNNAYNEIVNNKNTYIQNNTSISQDELQVMIDIAIKKAMGNGTTDPDNPNKPVNPDIPSIDTTDIVELLKSISSRTGNIDETVRQSVEQLLLIKTAINDKTDLVLQKMAEIIEKLGGDSGGSLFDFIRELLAEFLGNVLSDLLKFFIGEDGIDGAILEPAKALASSAQARFPACIPWDIIAIIETFSAEPETPVFKLPFKIEKLGIDEEIVIDFSKADSLAELSRTLFILTFLLFLLIQSRNLYGSLTGNV